MTTIDALVCKSGRDHPLDGPRPVARGNKANPGLTGGSWPTLVDLLQYRARQDGDYIPYAIVKDDDEDQRTITAARLDERARAIAVALLEAARPGDRAILLFPPGFDYIAAFFGCLYAGIVAVPAYPPEPARLARSVPRLTSIVRSAEATVVLTTDVICSMSGLLFPYASELARLRWIAADTIPAASGAEWERPRIVPDSTAFLQFTSGSTAAPRGVVLTHRCLLHNLEAIHDAFELGPHARGVCWLPPYHDMGLIGGILEPLYCGGFELLMSPLSFLQKPARWLRAISKYGAAISGGPNFAYDLCVRRIDLEKETLDLSSWTVAFNGAEVVRAETLDRFARKFEAVGFRREAFFPCYGLAEGTLIAAGSGRRELPVVLRVDAHALDHGRLRTVDDASEGTRALVSSGRPVTGVGVAIVDSESGVRKPDGELGEIWLSGDSVGKGYWGLEDQSVHTFQARIRGEEGRHLRTGDLGFLRDGHLFVAGRQKDVVIVRGRNIFPDDVERIVAGAHPSLRPGCTAAFAVDVDGTEHLAIAQEVDRGAIDCADVADAIRKKVAEAFDILPHDVVLLRAGTIPKTSSGKVQRHLCRAQWVDGAFQRAKPALVHAVV
jgi:acyl-CoA synthetase (AMP-forming)/AMP-acid ligase II